MLPYTHIDAALECGQAAALQGLYRWIPLFNDL
jgi:hypothetical protein